MYLAFMALVGLLQFQSTPIMALQEPAGNQPFAMGASIENNFYGNNFYGNSYYQRPLDMRSPQSGGVIVAQAIHSGRVRVPYFVFPQVFPFVLTCSPAPCTTANVRASEGGSPVNETPIAANPNNAMQLLTGGNDYNCASLQGFFASSNGGSTWNHTCMNTVSGGSGSGDPNVAYDTLNTAYIAGIDQMSSTVYNIVLEKSTNNGTTWSAPTTAVQGIPPYTFSDKPWMQIDDAATSARKNTIYISTTGFDPSNNSAIAVAHSTNHGVSFHNVMVDAVAYPVVDQFSDLAIGQDGTVYVSWMRCSASGPTGDCGGTTAMMLFSKSTDGGHTWSAPTVIAKPHLTPDSCGAFYGCLPNTNERVSNIPAIDIDRSGGAFSNRLYAVYYNWTSGVGAKMKVVVSHSTNGGATWSAGIAVGVVPHDQFFPWLTTNSTGVVGVTWLDRRSDSANIKYDAFATTSSDGGVTFITPNFRLSTASSDPNNDGFGGGFMGDYTGDIWVGKRLYASWTDTRTLTAQDEVGALRIP